MSRAAEFFGDLGYVPDSPEVNIADYLLDVIIRSPPEDVEHMVAVFKRYVVAWESAARPYIAYTVRANPLKMLKIGVAHRRSRINSIVEPLAYANVALYARNPKRAYHVR